MPNAPVAPDAAPASAPEGRVDDGAFAGVLAKVLKTGTDSSKAAASETATDETTETTATEGTSASAAGDLSIEMLMALLAQQTGVQQAGAQQAEAQAQADASLTQGAEGLVMPKPVAASSSGTTASVRLASDALSALMGAGLSDADEAVSPDEASLFAEARFTGALAGQEATTTDEAAVTGRDASRTDALGTALQNLSSALTPQTAQTQTDTTAGVNAALTQMQAQAAPPAETGLKATTTDARQTLQTYNLSAHTAENIAALSSQITRRLSARTTSFDMELRPTDMGKVEVRLEIGNDGKLTAQLRFDSPVAESEFRGRQDDLRRQLEQAGFQLEEGALSFSSGDQGQGRRFADAQPGDAAPEDEAGVQSASATDAHTLIDAQQLAADDPLYFARMSSDAYSAAQALSLSVLV
ncbi:MAG: flagellar hook-length control protein FliK [Asticcacaulis sp.]